MRSASSRWKIQPKLLRLLQEREYERLGEAKIRMANVRVIAATNRNLKEAVSRGAFREDLLYRLDVISLSLPPLRERPERLFLRLPAICFSNLHVNRHDRRRPFRNGLAKSWSVIRGRATSGNSAM